jgi:hypothetical protein
MFVRHAATFGIHTRLRLRTANIVDVITTSKGLVTVLSGVDALVSLRKMVLSGFEHGKA